MTKWILSCFVLLILPLVVINCEGDRIFKYYQVVAKKDKPLHSPKQSDDYIVVLKHGISTDYGLVAKHTYKNVFNGFSATMSADKYRELYDNPDVISIDPDIEVSICATQTLPVGIDRIDADLNPVADINGVDKEIDVDIAIFDTGIDAKHPDLNVVRQYDFTGEGLMDRHGHGTHVSGIAAARDNGFGVVGVAPGARLWEFKVLTKSGSGSLSGVIAGLDYAASLSNEIEVINMSLGGLFYYEPFRLAIQGVVNRGIVVVVAAGNYGLDLYGWDGVPFTNDDFSPACFPEVMTVSAMIETDGVAGGLDTMRISRGDDFLTNFTNHSDFATPENPVVSSGAKIDIAMPGLFVLSTWPHRKYVELSGTSMASPHGAGLVALYIAEHGRASNASGVAHIRQEIINNAEPQESWRLDGFMNDLDNNHEGLGKCLF